jgi:hypothetical protein
MLSASDHQPTPTNVIDEREACRRQPLSLSSGQSPPNRDELIGLHNFLSGGRDLQTVIPHALEDVSTAVPGVK